MKVAFFTYHDWEEEYISNSELASRDDIEIDFFPSPLDPEHVPQNAEEYDALSVFVSSDITEDVLNKFPNLTFISTRSTGYDHIACTECSARDVTIANVPTYGENTVAEFAFGLMLATVRRIPEGYDRLRADGQFNPKGLEGTDLKGKTLGVVGTGTIGKHMIRIAKGFGMEVAAHDPYPDEEYAQEMNYEYYSLEEMLGRSDIVTLHVPYMDETHHLLDEAAFEQIKDGAYIVNTSRGAVIDTQPFVKALQSGKLSGAGIDVLEEESILDDEMRFFIENADIDYSVKDALANYILIDMPNVVVTPHMAFNSTEAVQRIVDTTIENLRAFADGEPQNIVSEEN